MPRLTGSVCRTLFPYAAARSGLRHLEPTLKGMLAGDVQTVRDPFLSYPTSLANDDTVRTTCFSGSWTR